LPALKRPENFCAVFYIGGAMDTGSNTPASVPWAVLAKLLMD
jgi:hypothetical protein